MLPCADDQNDRIDLVGPMRLWKSGLISLKSGRQARLAGDLVRMVLPTHVPQCQVSSILGLSRLFCGRIGRSRYKSSGDSKSFAMFKLWSEEPNSLLPRSRLILRTNQERTAKALPTSGRPRVRAWRYVRKRCWSPRQGRAYPPDQQENDCKSAA